MLFCCGVTPVSMLYNFTDFPVAITVAKLNQLKLK